MLKILKLDLFNGSEKYSDIENFKIFLKWSSKKIHNIGFKSIITIILHILFYIELYIH